METEVLKKAKFSQIRYAQCWEDADLLMEASNINPSTVCLSISSAGDNTLALLARSPKKVIALDLNPAQLACLELRVAAYRELEYTDLLRFLGVQECDERLSLYGRLRADLAPETRTFWDARPDYIRSGIINAGKFERYFAIFRQVVLPLIHQASTVQELIVNKSMEEREQFYRRKWNSWRWQTLFKLFFGRVMMGALGRDPSFFQYVGSSSVSEFLLKTSRYALTKLNPADNPYLHWIVLGRYCQDVLPFSLRRENFELIRANLDKLEWRLQSLEQFTQTCERGIIGAFNLSDVFEYVSLSTYQSLLEELAICAAPGARLVYWNMLAQRQRPEQSCHRIKPLQHLADELYARNKTFFYSRFVVEEVAA